MPMYTTCGYLVLTANPTTTTITMHHYTTTAIYQDERTNTDNCSVPVTYEVRMNLISEGRSVI